MPLKTHCNLKRSKLVINKTIKICFLKAKIRTRLTLKIQVGGAIKTVCMTAFILALYIWVISVGAASHI